MAFGCRPSSRALALPIWDAEELNAPSVRSPRDGRRARHFSGPISAPSATAIRSPEPRPTRRTSWTPRCRLGSAWHGNGRTRGDNLRARRCRASGAGRRRLRRLPPCGRHREQRTAPRRSGGKPINAAAHDEISRSPIVIALRRPRCTGRSPPKTLRSRRYCPLIAWAADDGLEAGTRGWQPSGCSPHQHGGAAAEQVLEGVVNAAIPRRASAMPDGRSRPGSAASPTHRINLAARPVLDDAELTTQRSSASALAGCGRTAARRIWRRRQRLRQASLPTPPSLLSIRQTTKNDIGPLAQASAYPARGLSS